MFSEREMFSNYCMSGTPGVARSFACPKSFTSSVFLLCTALFAVLILFLGVIIVQMSVAFSIALLGVIILFVHILLNIKYRLSIR